MKENSLSPWGAIAAEQLAKSLVHLYIKEHAGYQFKLNLIGDSLWIVVDKNDSKIVAFRTAFSPASDLEVLSIDEKGASLIVKLTCAIGEYTVKINFPDNINPVLHYTVSLKPATLINVPFWPRDILIIRNKKPQNIKGEVLIQQVGTRTGLLYLSIDEPNNTSLLYIQNLTSLNSYFEETKTSAADTVGGVWPELGFSLPTNPDFYLNNDKEYIIADSFIAIDNKSPKNQFEIATAFTTLLARLYRFYLNPKQNIMII